MFHLKSLFWSNQLAMGGSDDSDDSDKLINIKAIFSASIILW
jgi:hypothetical protein